VHKSRSTKSTWINDIVLPVPTGPQVEGQESVSKDVTAAAADSTSDEKKKEIKQKLSDLEVRIIIVSSVRC